MLEGYMLRSDAMNRLSNTLQNIPKVMSDNRLREKQFDLTSAMTKRRMESQALGDRLTGLKIDAQEMANKDIKEERDRLNQPWDVGSMLKGISMTEHMMYPVGQDDKGQPRVVLDSILASVGGAKAQYDEKEGRLYAVLPDGSRVTQKHLQQYAPQFTSAMIAYTNPRKAMLDQVKNINREALKAGGMTPEMTKRKNQIMRNMEDPNFLLDAELKNLAIASAVPGNDEGIRQIQDRIKQYETAIMNRAETEGKRAESDALIKMRKAQAAAYSAQAQGQIEQNNIMKKGGGKVNSQVAMEMVKSYNKQIEEVNKALVSNSVNLQGEVVPLPPEMQEAYRARLKEITAGRDQWLSLAGGFKIADEKPTVEETDWAKMTAQKQSETIRDGAALASDLKDQGHTTDQIFAVLREKYPEKALPAIIQYLDVKSRRQEPKPKPEATKPQTPTKPISPEDMAGGGEKLALPAQYPAQRQTGRGFPEDSLIGRIQKNPAAYHPRQISFMTKYGDYHSFLKMPVDEAERHIREVGKNNNVPENIIESDIAWFKSMMEGK